MSDDGDLSVLIGVLGTEHFSLQSVAGATISESTSRTSIYLSALSSGLVAIGFASGHRQLFTALACTVLPTLFLLGCFTVVRLIDTSVENIVAQGRMDRIRRFYATVHPAAPPFFDAPEQGRRGVRYGRWSFLFTLASMVITVNSVLGGATVAVVVFLATNAPLLVAVGAGLLAGVAVLITAARYEHARVTPLVTGRDAAAAEGPIGTVATRQSADDR